MKYSFDDILNYIIHYGEIFGFMTIKVILIIFLGYMVSKIIRFKIHKLIGVTYGDETLSRFLSQAVNVAIFAVTLITVLGIFGVPTTSIIAAISAMGLAIALSLKDNLSSVASGILLILLRIYKKGDFVEIGSLSGNILAINLFNTHIMTLDGKVVIIPNSNVTSTTIINAGIGEFARIEVIIGVSYDSNLKDVKQTIQEVLDNTKELIPDKQIFIGVTELASSSVNFCVRFWIKREDGVFAIKSKVTEEIKLKLDENHIEIPYNKLDINIKKSLIH